MTEQHATTQPASPAVMRTLSEAARERQNAAAFNAERQRVSARIGDIARTLTEYERTLIELRNRDAALGREETAAMETVAHLIRMAELLCDEMDMPVPEMPELPPVAAPQHAPADEVLGQPYPSVPWSESPEAASPLNGTERQVAVPPPWQQAPAEATATIVDTPRADAPDTAGGEDAPADEGGFHPGDAAGDRDA